MNHYLVCDNPSCRFVLDVRVDGSDWDGRLFLSKCPQCGGKLVTEWPFAAPRPGGAMDGQTAVLLVLQRKAKR